MLEVRNLNKIYKTKKGVRHHALKDVSLKFEETGMVFILGKSGSGKSTLLNLLGGLDSYDSGEIIVKGKSSKDFKGRDFDSYRNTYLGFIFQEFYIMEDFTVEQNIGLALKLQHRKADKETIDDILRKVDLEGYGQRKPNELSGGQKQRVAIARALVKNPQVIMADEPTGQLDSATGKQVFQTLKKLSKEKLVLVVSHDRESAEEYGDRIIELSDGRVISDVKKVSYGKNSGFIKTERYEYLKDSYIHIKNAKELTRQDLEEISKMLLEAESEVFVSLNGGVSAQLYREYGSEGTKTEAAFIETAKAQNNYKQYGPGDFKLIKSKLPFKEAFLMGASGLKRKRIRLAFTIILSVISLVLFGVSDAFACYDGARALYDGLQKSGIKKVGISSYRMINNFGYEYPQDKSFEDELVARFEENFSDFSFIKAYNFSYTQDVMDFIGNSGGKLHYLYNIPYYSMFNSNSSWLAIADFSNTALKYKTSNSRAPQADDEILVTEYLASLLFELTDLYGSMNDVVGAELKIGGVPLKIAGIVDIGLDSIEGLGELKENMLPSIVARSELSSKLNSEEMVYARAGITRFIRLDAVAVSGEYGSYYSDFFFSIRPISSISEQDIDFVQGKSMQGFSEDDVVADSVFERFVEDNPYKPGEVAFLFFKLSDNAAKDMALLRFIEANSCRHVTPISSQIYSIDILAQVLKDVFFYMSVSFCVFAGLLLLNFISISVSYKKREIGILRALGSRQVDVFCVFAFEALTIVAIELVIAITGAFFVTDLLSREIGRQLFELMNIETAFTLFFFGFRQLLLMMALAVGVATLASFIPVKKIASMKPINAIKDI